jgi:hypothetical protein
VTDRPPTPEIPDPIRAAETTDTGNLGEAAAVKAFASLDWPATPTTAAQDLGTDLLIAARDRRFHRGEYLGAQVKSGASNLDSPITDDDGEQVGWWVRVTAKHASYWIDNALPHVLVLYDHTTDLCHWAHLNKETITSTGKGRKVKVAVAQVVNPEQAENLLVVAATARASVPLEGTAWTGAAPKASTDHLRFALVAPRLMAPHPNSGIGPATPAEAVALLMQARVNEVWPFGSPHVGVPSRKESATHETWAWRFVAALADWLTTGAAPDFEALRREVRSVHERAAVTAIIGHRHMAAGDPEAARALLQGEIDADEMAPVDHAWLHLQLARAHQELANLDEARRAATLSLAVGATQRHDVTATAIRGVAASILFSVSPLSEHDIASTIRYNDTAVAWWRSQTAYGGTVALVETAFDRAVGHEPSDHDGVRANNQVFAASVQAGVLGSHGQWRHLSGLLARQEFIDPQTTNVEALADSLGVLRRAGAERAAGRATWWVATNGPADAVGAATRGINLNRSTSSSIDADLVMLRVAADIVDEATATAAADWLEAAMADPTRLQTLTYRKAYDPQQLIAEHLEGIFQAIPREGAERTVNAIERFGIGFGVLAARYWAGVLTAIPRWAWTAEQVARLTALSSTIDEDELAAAVAFVRQAFDPAARDVLLDLIRADQIWALPYIDDLGVLAPNIIDEVRSICVARVAKDCAAEGTGSLSRGSARPLDGLVALTLAHPTDAAWDVVQRVIADSKMPAWYKQGAIARMANGHERIEGPRRTTLAAAVRAAGQVPPSQHWWGGDADMTGEVAYANVVLDDAVGERPSEIGRLAGGKVPHRRWAARLANDAGDVASLSILATDRSPLVRAEAAYGLARAATDHIDDPWVISTLRRAIGDRGRATGIAVAQVIADATDAAALAEVRTLLADHPSAEVRRLVREEPRGRQGRRRALGGLMLLSGRTD